MSSCELRNPSHPFYYFSVELWQLIVSGHRLFGYSLLHECETGESRHLMKPLRNDEEFTGCQIKHYVKFSGTDMSLIIEGTMVFPRILD